MTSPIFGSGTNLTLSRAISDIRDRLGTVSQEAGTGRRTDLTASLNGRIDTAFLAQRAIDGLETDRGQLNLREIRLDLVQQSLAHKSCKPNVRANTSDLQSAAKMARPCRCRHSRIDFKNLRQ